MKNMFVLIVSEGLVCSGAKCEPISATR